MLFRKGQMERSQKVLAGETANKYRARFVALKQQHPDLSRRGIIALLRKDPAICRDAERLGFGASESEVA